jgi:RNAse (barnase) inhibitor barstar
VLDCAEVIDKNSFFCALGEALNGPGGYYGKGLDSMHDCLLGGFGPTPPFRLDVEKLGEPIRLSSFYKEAVSVLETHGVTVADDRR